MNVLSFFKKDNVLDWFDLLQREIAPFPANVSHCFLSIAPKATTFFAPQEKGSRTGKGLVSFSLYGNFFELKPLAP